MRIRVYLVLACIFLLYGCSNNKEERFEDLHNYIANLKQTAATKLNKNAALITSSPPIQYRAEILRSPFDPAETAAQKKDKILNPLQSYPLSMLRFVGILVYNGKVFAVVMAPDNKVYQVKKGDIIGDHGGIVASLQQNQLNIMEPNENGSHIVTLHLKDEH
ncbi:MAG: hypothetical protein ACD_69C00244G0004 [uncultured bacterium]|nr:MAG: hypothetical protein ACD_69C00244G0004 [uncultured bacterium]OGT45428.1 MAG: hypothetical protein A3E83_00365 [Gammaproteobacteria bacterium RIFCSPHIGHO2_12_FULL_41_20]